MAIDRLDTMLEMQRQLQTKHMGGDPTDPGYLSGDEWADFIRWNAFALDDEIHEAMAEAGWKPWATSRHLNRNAFMKEMVDAWHFFMNMLLAASPGMTTEDIMTEFFERYTEKNAVNAQRQIEGYDGVEGKCARCHRELGPTVYQDDESDDKFCSSLCLGKGATK